jgi:hypothetical protein
MRARLDRHRVRSAEEALKVRIGNIEFDRVSYDRDVDVLYLHVGDPEDASEFDASVEGHPLRYDEVGRLVGVTLLGPRKLLAEEGRVTVTTPEGRFLADSEGLSEALASRAA